jgi:kynureninase
MAIEFQSFVKTLRAGSKPEFPPEAKSIEYAKQLDANDELGSLRNNFIIPTKASLKKKSLNGFVRGSSRPHPFVPRI